MGCSWSNTWRLAVQRGGASWWTPAKFIDGPLHQLCLCHLTTLLMSLKGHHRNLTPGQGGGDTSEWRSGGILRRGRGRGSALAAPKRQRLRVVAAEMEWTVALFISPEWFSSPSHFKRRCSSSSRRDTPGPVNTAKQANGIYFCQHRVRGNNSQPIVTCRVFLAPTRSRVGVSERRVQNRVRGRCRRGWCACVCVCLCKRLLSMWLNSQAW